MTETNQPQGEDSGKIVTGGNMADKRFNDRIWLCYGEDGYKQTVAGNCLEWMEVREHERLFQMAKYNYLGAIADYEHAMELLAAEKAKSAKILDALWVGLYNWESAFECQCCVKNESIRDVLKQTLTDYCASSAPCDRV